MISKGILDIKKSTSAINVTKRAIDPRPIISVNDTMTEYIRVNKINIFCLIESKLKVVVIIFFILDVIKKSICH